MRSRLHNIEKSHTDTLRFQHDTLTAQTIPAPEGYTVQAYIPSGLILQSERFSPSLAFPQGTSFAMVLDGHHPNSIRSLTSGWSIILDTEMPLCAETIPSFMERGVISTVPSTMDLYLFEGPSFTGQCRRVQVPPKESFLIGSLVMVPMSPNHIATFYTQENYGGCEVSVGEWANNTSPRMGGIRSMHLYQPLVLTSNEGLKRLFMAGDYPSVKMYGNVHSLSLPMDESDRTALMCEKGGACFSLFEEDVEPLVVPFDTYDIPPHMEVLVTMPMGTVALYGKGSVSGSLKKKMVDASFAYVPRNDTETKPSLCYEESCLSVGETPVSGMVLNVPITSLTVPAGWTLTMSYTRSYGATVYTSGIHSVSCILECVTCTIIARRM